MNNGDLAIFSGTGTILWESGTGVSDARLKTNIVPIEGSLDKLSKIKCFYYKYDKSIDPTERRRIGVSAENICSVFKEAAPSADRVNLERLVPLIVNAIKELKVENDLLEREISRLEQV